MPTLITLLSFLLRISLAATSPAAHQLTISVRLGPEVQAVEIAAQNEAYERHSAFETRPDRTQYVVEWRGVPSGTYEVRGRAVGNGIVTDSQAVRVVVR